MPEWRKLENAAVDQKEEKGTYRISQRFEIEDLKDLHCKYD